MKPLAAGAPLIALSLMLVASPADAQMGRGRSMPGGAARPNVFSPAPSKPRSAMLPVPRRPSTVAPTPTFASNPFRVPANGRSSAFGARPYTYAPRYAPRYDGRSWPRRTYGYPYGYGYGYGYYGYPGYAYPGYFGYGYGSPYSTDDLSVGAPSVDESNIDSPFATAPDESLGRLFFDTEPLSAQIIVDGIPAGTVADYRGVGMLLTEGVRQVELRAPGFQTATFDVDIMSQQPAVHRGDLTPLRRTAEAAAAVKRGSDKFYLIPGCYLGNRPPSEVSLPPGCDLTQVRTVK
jgi:hypothetical protein